MAKRLSRIERDIERLKEKISEYQQQLKELEAAKTEQENLQIIQLVRSMNTTFFTFATMSSSRHEMSTAIAEYSTHGWTDREL